MVYLDWAATALPDLDVLRKRCGEEEACFGNPSSPHSAGKKARELLSTSRKRVAGALGCDSSEVVFTSGGTESNNMILFSLLGRPAQRNPKIEVKRKMHIVTSGIEHPSVYNPVKRLELMGFRVSVIRAAKDGRVEPGRIAEALDEKTVLVSLMFVNNETGVVQRVEETGRLIREYRLKSGRRIIFHVDAVQGFGKLPFRPVEWDVDTAAISAHKLGGPKGSGALFIRKGIIPDFLYTGGEQEEKRRPGTEDIAGCYGFGLVAEKGAGLLEERYENATAIMERLMKDLSSIPGIVFIPDGRPHMNRASCSPYILKVAFPPIPGEVAVRMCDGKGFLVSTGSACSSRQKEKSHRVLRHMGIGEDIASSSIRISIGWETKMEDCIAFSRVLRQLVQSLK
ncbi:MAG: cysteine desulfurase [Spirochaetales bacterium]|nr:cysteine desulfurase [Spirochaetales bacterium]